MGTQCTCTSCCIHYHLSLPRPPPHAAPCSGAAPHADHPLQPPPVLPLPGCRCGMGPQEWHVQVQGGCRYLRAIAAAAAGGQVGPSASTAITGCSVHQSRLQYPQLAVLWCSGYGRSWSSRARGAACVVSGLVASLRCCAAEYCSGGRHVPQCAVASGC
jgi:hypothetical protein